MTPAWPTLAAALLVPCLAVPARACPGIDQGYMHLASAEAEIAYRWSAGSLRIGQFFEAEVVACRLPADEVVRTIVLDAQMPAHGHGMNYQPQVIRLAADRFRITGLMLHMAGHWRLTFDIFQSDRRTRLVHDVTLQP